MVASGANASLLPQNLAKAETLIASAAIVLMQLEIPLETVAYVAGIAAAAGNTVVLNPAPAREIPEALMRNISVLTPNKTEAEMLSGITINNMESAAAAASAIRNKGVDIVIITLGSLGALVVTDTISQLIHAPKVQAVDTTAAGDVFNGALAVALSENKPILEAVTFACHAAAISVTRMGTQASAPYFNEVTIYKEA